MDPRVRTLIISSVIMLALDVVFLRLVMGTFAHMVKQVQNKPLRFRYYSAAMSYVVMVSGLNYFILSDPKKTWIDAFLLGVLVYGVYETTNHAIFDGWTGYPVVVDTLWGGALFAMTMLLTKIL